MRKKIIKMLLVLHNYQTGIFKWSILNWITITKHMLNGIWMLCWSVRVMLPQTEDISCWKLCMTKLCIYFLKIATWNYDKYLTGCSSEWNYLYPGRMGSDMASSQTQGVPDPMALIELPRASIRSVRSVWAPCGWSQGTVVSWTIHEFLGTKSGTVPQNLPCRGVTSFPSRNGKGKILWEK